MNDEKQVLPLTIGKRRRHYSQALKQEMVAATLEGTESVSQIARRYGPWKTSVNSRTL